MEGDDKIVRHDETKWSWSNQYFSTILKLDITTQEMLFNSAFSVFENPNFPEFEIFGGSTNF